MKNFITTLKDIWKIEELKNKIILTLGLIAVYRFMAGVPLPGIDPLQLSALKESTSSGLLGLLNAFTGGAFSRASIMALGINALHFCIYCSSVNGNSCSIFTKITKRW